MNPDQNGEAWLARIAARRSTVFIDVGANVGDWAALFLESMPEGGRGFLFDPSEEAAKKLRRRFRGIPGIEITAAAVSEAVGEAPFFEEPGAGETSSLVQSFSLRDTVKRLVPLTTLDVEAERRRLGFIDFVKIDAEGHDLQVLRGASALLTRQRIGIIQFEYHKPWAATRSTLGEAYALLESFGYGVFLLKAGGLFSLDYERYKEYFGYSNYVAVAPERMAELEQFVKGRM